MDVEPPAACEGRRQPWGDVEGSVGPDFDGPLEDFEVAFEVAARDYVGDDS